MAGDELEIVDGAAAGAWIEPELGGLFGAVSLQVPRRYAAYARILHPVWVYDRDRMRERLVRWADVGAATRRRVHPEVQWHALVGSSDSSNFDGALWDDASPDRGDLGAPALTALVGLLAGFSRESERFFFAVWTGYNWGSFGWTVHEEDGRNWAEPWTRPNRSTHDLSWRFPEDQVAGAALELPGREYVVLAGPLDAARSVAGTDDDDECDEDAGKGPISPNSPQMIWPADRAWFVASEIDFDSTLVGGGEDLIAAILASPDLEAWRVGPDSSLASDADRINPVPDS